MAQNEPCCDEKLRAFATNICYKILSIRNLGVMPIEKYNENTICYLAIYPLEFLLKAGMCLANNNYKKVHIGNALFSAYDEMILENLPIKLDTAKLKNLKLSKVKNDGIRYNPQFSFTDYGFTNFSDMEDELKIIIEELKKLEPYYMSKLGGAITC